MSKRFLTKVMAGVALAGAALLMSAPSASVAGDFDFKSDFGFKHDKFKGFGYISGIAVVDSTGTSGVLRITQVCSKPQKPGAFAQFEIPNDPALLVTVPLELVFPTADVLFFKLLALSDKFDHDKKFDFHDEKFDFHGKFDDRKFDFHDKKFDKKDDKKHDGIFFVYENTVDLTEAQLALLEDGQTLLLRGTCATGILDVIVLEEVVANG